MRNFGLTGGDLSGRSAWRSAFRKSACGSPSVLERGDIGRAKLDDPRIILFPRAAASRPFAANLPGGDKTPSGLSLITALKLSNLSQSLIDISTALIWFALGCIGLVGVALAFGILGFEIVSALN